MEWLTSGAFGAIACIFLSMSLFTSLFFGFLSYIKCYLSKKRKGTKKNVVSLHYGLCQRFLKENVLCVFSFCAVKMSLLSIEII